MYLGFVLNDALLVFVLVDEFVFVLFDGLVKLFWHLSRYSIDGCVLVEAFVCVPVEQHFSM